MLLQTVLLFTFSASCNAVSALEKLESNNSIVVDVLYESLCINSISFVTQQLIPAFNQLKDTGICNI